MAIIYFLCLLLISPSNSVSDEPIKQQSDCEIIENGIDLQTKKHRIEIGRRTLLRHTPPEIKDQLLEQNLLNVVGHLIQEDEDLAVHLNIRVNSLIAQDHFGSIDQGFKLNITLLDGKTIDLICFAGSPGVLASDQAGYIYPVGYGISTRQLKQLSRLEIDKIGMQWSSGYEEYPVYEVDFFLNQIACLNRAQNSN